MTNNLFLSASMISAMVGVVGRVCRNQACHCTMGVYKIVNLLRFVRGAHPPPLLFYLAVGPG